MSDAAAVVFWVMAVVVLAVVIRVLLVMRDRREILQLDPEAREYYMTLRSLDMDHEPAWLIAARWSKDRVR